MAITKIRKRDGTVVDFDKEKIVNAIFKSAQAVGGSDREESARVADHAIELLGQKFKEDYTPTVEDVQDIVEKALIDTGHATTAKSYILYRHRKTVEREAKRVLGVKDDLKLPLNSVQVLERRYLLKDDEGKVIETPSQLFRRVADFIASNEKRYEADAKTEKFYADAFYEIMTTFEFLPNSPTLMNAGTGLGQLSACFVLPVKDDIEQIFDSVKHAAIIHKTGGGCILKGSRVYSTFCGSEAIDRLYDSFDSGSNVIPENGAFYIDISDESIRVPSFDKSTGSMAFVPVQKIWKYILPSEKTFTMKAVGGYHATTSEWHPFFVFENGAIMERRADELKAGDLLITSNPTLKDAWAYSKNHVMEGIELDEDLAWLAGIFSTDGSLDEIRQGPRFRVFSADQAIIDRALDIVEKKTGKRYAVETDYRSKNPVMRITAYDKALMAALKRLNRGITGNKTRTVRIPAEVFKSPLPIIGAYLGGVIDGDGHIQKSKPQMEISGASKEFMEDLCSLFSLFGIKSRYRRRVDPRNPDWVEMYEVSVSGQISLKRLADLVLPYIVLERKRSRLEAYMKKTHSSSPANLDFALIEPILNEAGIDTKNTEIWRKSVKVGSLKIFLARWKKKGKVNQTKAVSLLEELLKMDVSAESKQKLNLLINVLPSLMEIKSVTRSQAGAELEFYDFTVPGTQNYLAGNMGLSIIHNTGFCFSYLRPKGDYVKSTAGVASGPLSFMSAFDNATNVIKQGGCVSSDSLVRTTKGVMALKRFLNCPKMGDAPADALVFTNGSFSNAYLAEDNGLSEVEVITTEIGTELKATYNHSVCVVDADGKFAWKEVSQLKKDDWVVHVLGGHCGMDQPLPKADFKLHFNANKVRIPKKMSPDLAELLGMYVANGCISGNRIIFAVEKKDKQLIMRLKTLMAGLFNLTFCRMEEKENDASYCMVFYSKELAKYFGSAGWKKNGAKDAFIPDVIFESSEQSARAFLKGLFEGDGDVHSDGYPRLYSISERLIKQVQQLLFGLGIVSTWHSYDHPENRFGKTPICHLMVIQQDSMEKFSRDIGFITSRKNNLLSSRKKARAFEYFDVIPNQEKLLRSLYRGPGRGCAKGKKSKGADRVFYKALQHYLGGVSTVTKRNLTRMRLKSLMARFEQLRCEQLEKVCNEQYFYSRVKEITHAKDYTMDIMVPGSEKFVANSMLVHNKRRGANMGVLHVWHPDIEEFITAKQTSGVLENFNVSVAIDDKFMKAVESDGEYELINPRNSKVVRKVSARSIFKLIAYSAWKSAEPGLLFIDEINRRNPTPKYPINSTNPCVVGDTIVTTSEGLIEIPKVHNPHWVLGHDGGYHPVRWAGETGEKEVFLVRTEAGYEAKATADHMFLTTKGWKQVRELTKKDRLVVQKEGAFGNGHIDKQMALMLGWLVGDGTLTKGAQDAIFYFGAQEKEEMLPLFKSYLDKLNGSAVRPIKDKTETRLKYSSKIAARFQDLGVKPVKAENKEVPASVFTMDRETVALFLSALFGADGSVQGSKEKGISIRLASNSSRLLKQVQVLLLQFGIVSKVYENRRNAHVKMMPDSDRQMKAYSCKAQHELIISRESMFRFMQKIGFCIAAKNEKFARLKPKEIYSDDIDLSVKSVEKAGVAKVYDLTEPTTHSFSANGLMVHNCGEVPMPDYESCNLGSINLVCFVDFDWSKTQWKKKVDWKRMRYVIRLAVQFLDNVIDLNNYPIPQIKEHTIHHRRIGLGIMGFSKMLAKIGVRYDSPEALEVAEETMKFVTDEAMKMSHELGRARGSFPGFAESTWAGKYDALRNATVTSIAPTGTISMIADSSSGIEPMFALSYIKTVMDGTKLYYSDDVFEHVLKVRGLYSPELMQDVIDNGTVQGMDSIPKEIQNVFVVAHDIPSDRHVMIQAAFQRHTDLAVSKTINMPAEATVEDVERAYMLAWKEGCKGITIYRDGSRGEGVLTKRKKEKADPPKEPMEG